MYPTHDTCCRQHVSDTLTLRGLYMLYYSSPQLSNSACNRVHDKQAVEAKVRDDDIIIRIPVQNADSRRRMTAQNYTLYSVCLSVCSSVCMSRDNLLLENEQTFRGGYLREELMAVSSQCYCGGGGRNVKLVLGSYLCKKCNPTSFSVHLFHHCYPVQCLRGIKRRHHQQRMMKLC